MRQLTIFLAFALSGAGSTAFAVLYVLGGQPQLEGVFLAVALGGLALGLGLWGKAITPADAAVEEWEDPGPEPEEREEGARDHEHREAVQRDLPDHERPVLREHVVEAALQRAREAEPVVDPRRGLHGSRPHVQKPGPTGSSKSSCATRKPPSPTSSGSCGSSRRAGPNTGRHASRTSKVA